MTTGKADKRYCFGLGMDKWGVLGKFPDATSSLEVLEKAEAKSIFRKFDEEGLMHSIWSGITPYVIGICNCDRDCGAYKGYIEMRWRAVVLPGRVCMPGGLGSLQGVQVVYEPMPVRGSVLLLGVGQGLH